MAAASRGIFVPGRNFCLTSIPGVGKSTFVEVIQHHFCRDSRNNAALWGAPVNTVRIRATDIFDCVYAASSKKLMALFSQIHRETRARGCVTLLVIDEFDALVGSSGNEQDETVGVIRAFQQWADNTHTDANKSANVFILATTNHPERIDPAVLSRFTCYPFAAANSLNAKAIAALWQGTPWLRLVIFQNHGLPEITTENLSMALARDLPIRTVERICDEIKRRHLALPTAAATHAALFAFCQAMLAAQQAHRARHRPAPGAAPIFVEVAHSAYLLALPWQDLARLRADDQAPFASPFGCISYRATPTQIDFVMVAQGGLHLISLQPQLQQRLMQTFKIEAAVHLGDDQARGRVITHVGDRALRLNCEIDPGLSTLCQIVLPLGDIDSALLPTETLQAATLALEIGLPAPAVAAVDDLFARPYAANFG